MKIEGGYTLDHNVIEYFSVPKGSLMWAVKRAQHTTVFHDGRKGLTESDITPIFPRTLSISEHNDIIQLIVDHINAPTRHLLPLNGWYVEDPPQPCGMGGLDWSRYDMPYMCHSNEMGAKQR